MARSRIIKPEFWDDEKLSKAASRDARLLFVGMWNYSDDYGVVKGNPSWLKNKIFPYDDDITPEMFKKWLNELESKKFIIPFVISDELFYFIKNFHKHQTINKPSITRNPTPPVAVTEDYGSTTEQLPSEREVEVKENKKGNKGESNKTTLPDDFEVSERVKAWAQKNSYDRLEEHLESFKLKCRAKNYKYVSWDDAFMTAIREDWAKLRSQRDGPRESKPLSAAGQELKVIR